MRKTRGYAMHKAGNSLDSTVKVLNDDSPALTMRYVGLVLQDIDNSLSCYMSVASPHAYLVDAAKTERQRLHIEARLLERAVVHGSALDLRCYYEHL